MGNILLGLVPALMWGLQPLVMQKIGGKATNQQMGMSMGTLLFSVGVLLFHQPTEWNTNLIIASLLCGIFWSFGQINQIKSFHIIGVSRAMPISTGTQLLGTTLVGVLYFREWTQAMQFVLGISALVLIVAGVAFTAFQEKEEKIGSEINMKRGMTILIVSSAGFVLYAVIPRIADINGWDAVFPQAIGMFIGSILFCSFEKRPEIFGRKSFQNILTGLFFAVANVTIMLSNEANGVALGFTLSQMNVVVSTVGGLVVLHETKTSKELKYTLGGLILVLAGGILIGMTK
ncbi:GRP family sugar transporter [Tetragenococcus koreensis]|uniref:GRP family sugar transporter n=1 Tax=Tetragenococcus koreensis TaxID=290335 RepID=UPI001F47C571|nr:GRP family sugar transporter [Tetragenococcus koreensis]MCF1586112.1 GRP family sugar transporter [Tetragenococcus koreensis]MCF1615699.1 GRP family sugar transporter [Tetragenococcus koreensis]MCF1618873.1 GRP family sugar transporter [Tetragenococcus koreensis]MCF1625496.1 GRP family sugar transporter [Tetragenococcus koreensis]MCF1630385.1 GRP family sugar transporter [Tetragenococcus koreensis]